MNEAARGSVESTLRKLSFGTVAIFVVVLAAFVWVERRLGASLSLNEELVVPAREAADRVEGALGQLVVRQSRIAGASSAEAVAALADRAEAESALRAVRGDIRAVAGLLAQRATTELDAGFSSAFERTFERFLAADARFATSRLEAEQLAESLEGELRSVERALETFLESAQGISGKMRFAYGSDLREIERELARVGWTRRVRRDVRRVVLGPSNRRNMIVGDVLGLAGELNRLSGKIGLVTSADQLRSLYANELVQTRDRLRVALEELRYETRGEQEIQAIASQLQAQLDELSNRILAKEDPSSLIALKGRLLDADAQATEMQTELARLATLATGLTETLVGAAESESEVFASALRAAGGTARGLLLAVVVAAAIGGFIGWKSVRGSLAQLRAQNDDLRRLKDELTVLNEGLEAKVAERTAALDAKNQAMKMVLDNVEQGLATLNREGMLESERSARFDDWFGARIDGVPLARLLGEKDAKTGSYFELAWGELMDGIMPLEVNLAQLPRRVTFGGRTVELAYRAMETDGDVPERTLVVATDVTEQLERQRAEAAEREFARVFRHLMRDRGSFTDFFEEADATVRRLGDAENEDTQALFRAIHTLKGNCALYGLERMAELCHEVETGMVDEHRGPSEDEIARVRGVWGDTSKRIRQLLHDTNEGMAQVSHAEIDHLLGQLRAVDTPKHVVQTLERWHHEPVGARLERIGDQAKQLAKRLGKGDIEVSIRGEDVRLPRERLAGFWASLAHVVRNAMDHGLEAPDQRAAVGKSPHGHFEVAVEESADAVRVMLSDDGAGIDWDKLKAKARQAGLPDVGHDALVDVLFTDGVSSRDDVSAVSGRGVGMGAVRGAAERLGARIDVTSANGEGTTFTFSLPKRALRADATGTEVTGTLDLSPGDEGPRSP